MRRLFWVPSCWHATLAILLGFCMIASWAVVFRYRSRVGSRVAVDHRTMSHTELIWPFTMGAWFLNLSSILISSMTPVSLAHLKSRSAPPTLTRTSLLELPPNTGRSFTRATLSPSLAAAMAAQTPAIPPPITARS
jgi:hypothetical protein